MNYYVYASAVLLYCFTLLQLFSNICSTEHDSENNRIKIWNNGKGIPVVEHKEEKMYVPTLIFGHLLTSSNYNDFEKKVTGKLFTLIQSLLLKLSDLIGSSILKLFLICMIDINT